MAIGVTCGECFYPFSVPERSQGEKVRCPACGAAVTASADAGSVEPTPAKTVPPKPSSVGQPRTKRPAASSAPTNRLLIGAVVGGGTAVFLLMVTLAITLSSRGENGDAGADRSRELAAIATRAIEQLSQVDTRPQSEKQTATESAPPSPPDSTVPDEPLPTTRTDALVPSEATPVSSPSPELDAEPVALTTVPPVAESVAVAEALRPQPGSVAPLPAVEPRPRNDPVETPAVPFPGPSGFSTAELVARVEPAVVRVDAIDEKDRVEWHGSGFIVHPSGLVATSYQVVAGAHKCVVQLANRRQYAVSGYYGADKSRDVVFLKLRADSIIFRTLPLAEKDPAKGEPVLAFGCPFDQEFTTTDGLVSGLRSGSDLKRFTGADVAGYWVQTSATISAGNSGGPLVNMRGEVVGLNSWIRTGRDDLNYAVSAEEVRRISEQKEPSALPISRTSLKRTAARQSNDELAQKYLARIETVELRVQHVGPCSRDNLDPLAKDMAEQALRGAGVRVVSAREKPKASVKIVITAQDGENGTAEVAVSGQILWGLTNGRSVIATPVWTSRTSLGSPRKVELYQTPREAIGAPLGEFLAKLADKIAAAKLRE